MGVFEKFKDLVGIEEYDEDYEDDVALEEAEKTPEPDLNDTNLPRT